MCLCVSVCVCVHVCAEGVNCHISVVNSSVPLHAAQMTYVALSPTFVGDVLQIEEEKGPAPDYYLMYMQANDVEVCVLARLLCVAMRVCNCVYVFACVCACMCVCARLCVCTDVLVDVPQTSARVGPSLPPDVQPAWGWAIVWHCA